MVRFSCSKSEAIKALWKHGKAVGLGLLQSHVGPTDDQIATVVARGKADYLNGKPMKINLDNWPEIHPGGYDRENGLGAMQDVSDSVSRGDATDLAGGETKELNASERAQVIREANASLQVTSFCGHTWNVTSRRGSTWNVEVTVEDLDMVTYFDELDEQHQHVVSINSSSISALEGDADACAASSCEPAGDTSAAGPRAPPHPAQGACGRSSAGAF